MYYLAVCVQRYAAKRPSRRRRQRKDTLEVEQYFAIARTGAGKSMNYLVIN